MTDIPPRLSYAAFAQASPDVHAALSALGAAVDESGLEKSLTELVKLRASLLNGCAFCLQYHLSMARKAGLAAEKIDLLAAWREAGVYTPREEAALAWTDSLTLLGPNSASDADHAALVRAFGERQALSLTIAIGTINQWNRIARALRFAPPLTQTREQA